MYIIHKYIYTYTYAYIQALTKIRKSLREKKSASSAGIATVGTSPYGGTPAKQSNLKKLISQSSSADESSADMVAAYRDEAQASKEVIGVLQSHVEQLELEKETL